MPDERTFEELYGRHAPELLRYCFRRTGDAAAAEDLVAIVFLEAWRRRDDLRPATARAWLFGIATNVARNHRRQSRRHREALSRLARERPAADDGVAEAEARMRELLTDLRRLPRRDLDVLALCAWSGLSYEEAAAALAVPVGTVRSRMARARGRLERLARERDGARVQPVPDRSPT